MKYFYSLIIIIGLASCKDFSLKAKNELLVKLNGSWQTILKKTSSAKYSRLDFVNDSIVACHSQNNIDTLSYDVGIRSVRLYTEEDMTYFYVKEIDKKYLTLIEDVSDKLKSEKPIHYERNNE